MTIQTAETKKANPILGKEESYELAGELNQLLSDYMVVYQKLRNYHWNVVGGEFYDVHEKFEEEYNTSASHIDAIAERMRMLGFKPVSTLRGFIEMSHIHEVTDDMEATEMVHDIIKGYRFLIKDLHAIVKRSLEHEDYGTDFMARNMMTHLEQKVWMFESFVA